MVVVVGGGGGGWGMMVGGGWESRGRELGVGRGPSLFSLIDPSPPATVLPPCTPYPWQRLLGPILASTVAVDWLAGWRARERGREGGRVDMGKEGAAGMRDGVGLRRPRVSVRSW